MTMVTHGKNLKHPPLFLKVVSFMGQGSKNLETAFSAVFFLTVLGIIFSRLPRFLRLYFHEQGVPFDDIIVYYFIASYIIPLASTLLVLAGVYLLARKIDLSVELRRTVILLLVGGYLANFVGVTLSEIIFGQPTLPQLQSRILQELGSTSFLDTFFLAFTAVSLAYFRTLRF